LKKLSIPGFNEAQLVEVLSTHLTPSKEIEDPKHLVGREKYLTRIRRALYSPGRHVFIYGERGVGKTSIAVTAGRLATEENKNFIYVPCGQSSTFLEIISAVGRAVLDNGTASKGSGRSFGLGLGHPMVGNANVSYGEGASTQGFEPKNLSEAIEVLKFVRSQMKNQIIVVIDELDRVANAKERAKFSELLKNISASIEDMRFVLCGIGANVDEIIGEHLSTGRMFEPVEVAKLNHTELHSIVTKVSSKLGLEIDRGFLIRIGIISDGFPHFVHLIGECLFYAMHDDLDDVIRVQKSHFQTALTEALQKAEPSLRRIYQIATEKSRNRTDYEEALWALADRTSSRRQVTEIYDTSYRRISRENGTTRNLDKHKFNSRLLTLRKESHASIIVGHGSGWFSFRENVVRGYVRLKAETSGVQLVPELTD
jgi:Cdc6-like AAA superfamily ATPase